jgi:enamine deaminase RidA (YjgF/YER057c/UK114 family)
MMVVTKGPGDLDFLTWLPDEQETDLGQTVSRAYEEIRDHLDLHGAALLQERVFGELSAASAVLKARAKVLGTGPAAQVPPTIIEGAPCSAGLLAGIHAVVARPSASGSAHVVRWQGSPCGRRVEGTDADYLGLSDVARLLAPGARFSPESETRETLLLTDRLLDAERWSFNHVCRTWFYLDDILSWYDDFNQARNSFFADLGLLNGSPSKIIPASTGIRGRNQLGHRCTLDLVAIRPRENRRLAVEKLHNPLQNEAPEYGSAFSRGLTIATDTCRYFLVSGTASIDERGNTVHPGDFESQTRRTLDNIESLIASRGAVMDDICQATAFVKREDDIDRFAAILADRGLDRLPLVCTIDDICRDDLLVEIDATAVVTLLPPGNASG